MTPSPHTPAADGGALYQSKIAFEQHIRELQRPYIGDEADEMTEADFVSDLGEDGWPHACAWRKIFCRIHDDGELTPREREQALAYWMAGEEYPAAQFLMECCCNE